MKAWKMIKTIRQLVLIVGCLIFTQTIFGGGVAVIVNPASTLTSVKSGEIKAVYLNKSKKIAEITIKPIDNAASDVRTKFLKTIVRKNPKKFKAYWARLVFSGKSAPLQSVANDIGAKQWVNSHPDSIGFINSKNIDDTVKVIYQF